MPTDADHIRWEIDSDISYLFLCYLFFCYVCSLSQGQDNCKINLQYILVKNDMQSAWIS